MKCVKNPYDNISLDKFDTKCDALLFADGKIYPSLGKNHDWNIIRIAEKHYPDIFKEILENTECSSYKEIEECYAGQLVMGYSFSNRNKILRYCAKYEVFNTCDFPITLAQYNTLKKLANLGYISPLEYEKCKLDK